MSCWASAIGGCDDKISREHVVSKGLFDSKVVEVSGLSWCKDKPVKVGIDSITRKILCTKHNNDLSPLDSAAIDAFDCFRAQARLMAELKQHTIPTSWNHCAIDARRLERWFLKTLINVTFEGPLPIGFDGEPGKPSDNLVRTAYGHEGFKGDSGMYIGVAIGMKIETADKVRFAPLIHKGAHIVGGLFTFRGLHAVLSLDPAGLDPEFFHFSEGIDSYWRGITLRRPFDKIDFQSAPRFVAHTIVFDWGDERPRTPKPPKIEVSETELIRRLTRSTSQENPDKWK